jgi:methylmalonyl-CoA mutase N-terminal domain/subunit
VERLRTLRENRDQAKWQAAVKQVEDTPRGTGKLMPVIVEAVEANATVGGNFQTPCATFAAITKSK